MSLSYKYTLVKGTWGKLTPVHTHTLSLHISNFARTQWAQHGRRVDNGF